MVQSQGRDMWGGMLLPGLSEKPMEGVGCDEMSAAAPTTAAGGLFGWMSALPQLPLSLPAPVMHFSTRGLFAPAAMEPPSSCSGDHLHVNGHVVFSIRYVLPHEDVSSSNLYTATIYKSLHMCIY